MTRASIPDKKNLHITKEHDDCSRFYYVPIIKYFYLKRLKMIIDLIKDSEGGSVLDIGCGSGVLFYELKEIFSDLNGLDLRRDINQIKESLERDKIKVNLINGDLLSLPYKDGSFDCIVSVSVLEHIRDLERVVNEIRRVLKKGGKFICGFPVKNVLMHQFFKIIKFDDEKNHPSDQQRIFGVLERNFNIEKTIKFPSFFKMDRCLYVACRCCKIESMLHR